KNDWDRIKRANEIEFPTIELDKITMPSFDIRSCNEWNVLTQCIACPIEDVMLLAIAQEIDIASIHVEGIHQTSLMCCLKVTLKSFDSDLQICIVGKKSCCDALYFSARAETLTKSLNRIVDSVGHRCHRFLNSFFSVAADESL